MTGTAQVLPAGSWVEVERILLEPEQRAAGLPPETADKPYVLRLNGFLTAEARIGDDVTVTSLIGHEHEGRLVDASPGYDHTFGPSMPELLRIGLHESSAAAKEETS